MSRSRTLRRLLYCLCSAIVISMFTILIRSPASQKIAYPRTKIGISKHIRQEGRYVFDASWELQYISDASKSTMVLQHPKMVYNVGSEIEVRIQMFDSQGRPKERGGDFIKVWMVEDTKGAKSAGVVEDHENGTYTGRVRALWSGSPTIQAVLSKPREMKDVLCRVYRDYYTLRNLSALYECDGVREEHICLPIPNIRGYKHLCNLTAENYGLPMYCGKPKNEELMCQDFAGYRTQPGQKHLFTPIEAKVFQSDRLHKKLPTRIQLTVNPDKDDVMVQLPSTPCNKLPRLNSWIASTPVGFFYKNKWHSLDCKPTINTDKLTYLRCLQNRTLWIHGDSTSRNWYAYIEHRLNLAHVTKVLPHKRWHKPAVLAEKSYNLTVKLIYHEYPFYSGSFVYKLAFNRATHAYLDEISADSRDVILLHMYLHFNAYPPEVYRTHVRRMAQAVRSLLSRAQNVIVAIRGTHAFKGWEKIGFLDDLWMFEYDNILREEFSGLEDKVLYLNNIDLTISTENDDQHPNSEALTALVEHFMASICH